MDALAYYKLKATLLESRAKLTEFARLTRQRDIQAILEAGLDPAVNYTFDDAGLTAIPDVTIKRHSKTRATEE